MAGLVSLTTLYTKKLYDSYDHKVRRERQLKTFILLTNFSYFI